MTRLRRFASAFWLALALVVGQQAAALHDLGHATARLASQHDSTPAKHSADECFLCAAFLGAAVAPPLALHLAETASVSPVRFDHRSALTAARLAFRSQAPPVLL
jgi:predicted HD phosphohydrolase